MLGARRHRPVAAERPRRRRRLARLAAFPAVLGLVVLALPGPGPAVGDASTDAVESVTGLALPAGDAIVDAVARAPEVAALRPAAKGIRVAIVSSGVDVSVLPDTLRSQVTLLGNGGDPIGYGTYAASVLLQLVPDARITSIGIYPNGRFHPDWQAGALNWAVANASSLDAVLYAVPPSEFLDPVSAAMATGRWNATADVLSSRALAGSKGPVFGDPLWGNLRNALTDGRPNADRADVNAFAGNVGRWAQARAQVQAVLAKGVAVVAPAGDLGPGPQTVFGLANLPEVVAVGGFDGQRVSTASSSGPSMDGRVKPDLVARTGLVGLLPPASALARSLGAKGLLDKSLQPVWGSAGAPLTDARARLDSTMTAATVVAAAAGGLAAQGVRDVARQRGALTLASVPLPDVPVWRQGAGVLRRIPDATFAASQPLVTGFGDLGAEPEAAPWTTTVPLTGGAARSASTALGSFIGVGVDGHDVERPSLASDSAPPVSATVDNGGVHLTAPLGDGRYQGGLFCGYTDVSVPLTDATVQPGVDADGIPRGAEQVPTCLVEGTRLRAFGFYIHDIPAEDLTFALLPAIPVGQSLLEHPLMLLPVDPLATKLFFKVTGADGNADFPNVPPGYYRVRQFSDYGAPVADTVTDSKTGLPVVHDVDVGEKAAYQSFDALVLSAVCTNETGPAFDAASQPRPCTEQFLKDRFGEDHVHFEKTTGAWLVDLPAGQQLRVVFGFLKKMPGAGVASRYVDLLKREDLRFATADVGTTIDPAKLAAPATSTPLWSLLPSGTDPTAMNATTLPVLSLLSSGATATVNTGVAAYPFNLTTPNYKAHMSLNMGYDLTNAAVVVVVVVGDSVGVGVVTPAGTIQGPSAGLSQPIGLSGLTVQGHATGRANFELSLFPKGASKGTLYLVFVPPSNTVVSSATLRDVSFELDTWTNTLWPPTVFPGDVRGHSFQVSSNYSDRQMSDPQCRALDNGTTRAQVCEDWEVMVHSPGDDAATFDIVDTRTDASVMDELRAAGGGLFDPHRGVHDFSHVLAFATPTVAGVDANVSVPNLFRTNGRFWEQLALTRGLLRAHPGTLEVHIVDNQPGRQSTLLPHADGPVPVAPYVPFTDATAFLRL